MRIPAFACCLLPLAAITACAAAPAGAPATTTAQAATSSAPNAAAVTGSAKTTLPSGVIFESVTTGSGPSPKATDTVKVNYRGTLPDGREFDSSYKRGQPASFPLNRVIPCWTQAVQLMKPGGKARVTCPPDTAYGSRGAGGVIPPNATLMFDIELISIGS
jgi:FKBP-type peptidyl-prolyl cis-trans isomerase FkpA